MRMIVRGQRAGGRVECDDQVVAAPRSAGVAKVVLRSHKTLLHAVKRDGSVEQVLGADSPELEAV